MKAWHFAAASIVALAGCKANNEAPAPAIRATPPMAPAAVATPPTAASMTGKYDVTEPDGSKIKAVLAADGTYTDRDAATGKLVDSGSWKIEGGKVCFAGKDGNKNCVLPGPVRADGTSIATSGTGARLAVKRTS